MKRLYRAVCSLLEVKLEKHRTEIESLLPRDTGRMAKDHTPPSSATKTWGELHADHNDFKEPTMADLPGYYMPHCTNCMASTHSVHNCPYNEGDDDDQ